MKKLANLMMTMALMALTVNVASAQPGQQKGYGYSPGSQTGKGLMWQRLNLTEEQQEKIAGLRLEMQKELLPLRNQLGEKRAKMRTLATTENADLKALNRLIDESKDLQAEMAKLRLANRQQIRKLLTEEQRIMFDSRPLGLRGNKNFNRPGCRYGGRRGAGFNAPPKG